MLHRIDPENAMHVGPSTLWSIKSAGNVNPTEHGTEHFLKPLTFIQ